MKGWDSAAWKKCLSFWTCCLGCKHLLQLASSFLPQVLLNPSTLLHHYLLFHFYFSLQFMRSSWNKGWFWKEVCNHLFVGGCRESCENVCYSPDSRSLRATGEWGRLIEMPVISAMPRRSQKYLLLSWPLRGWKCPIMGGREASCKGLRVVEVFCCIRSSLHWRGPSQHLMANKSRL